jgi:2-polyprenyl-3-methyl-5-hydroxy-6-metoxy-1,4-benzoquinol methylase
MDGFVNKRARKMWEQIVPNIDFTKKTVIDVGCGPGDFIGLALKSGAKHVIGIDMDYAILLDASTSLKQRNLKANKDFVLLCDDINELVEDNVYQGEQEIAICFSCLPYLNDVEKTLKWLSGLATESVLIESQYFGDGPGPIELKNDKSMKNVLLKYWCNVEKIGETDVEIRPATRSIWICEGACT